MGLFSGKKKIYVSSVVYPLGEDEGPKKRDFLKYTVLNAQMQGQPIADSITQGYLKGQGMALRNCFQYAREKYTEGVPVSSAKYLEEPNRDELTAVLSPLMPGWTIEVLTLVTGTADHEWWAEQYLAQEFGYDRTEQRFERPPSGVDADAAIAYDLEPNGTIRILLMSAGGATKVIDFRPGNGYKAMENFVHCAYRGVQVFDSGIVTEVRPKNPGEVDSVSVDITEVVRAGETQTTTIRTTVDVDETGPNTTVKTSKLVEVVTRPQYFLYRLGAGAYPVIDAWVSGGDLVAPYYPAIPLRRDNKDMRRAELKDTELYKTSQKLLKRLGFEINDLAEDLNSNAGVKDVDYAYVVFGVSLNTKSQEGRRYLFNFFQYLRGITSPNTTKSSFAGWASRFNAGQTKSPPQINMIEIYSAKDRANNYDVKIQWDYIDTQIKSGVIFEGAGVGDCDVQMGGTRTEFSFLNLDIKLDNSKLYVRRQLDADTYEELEIAGLVYDNYIYKGKSVSVSAWDMFSDPDEQGFIVPLNQQIVRQMGLRDVTDLSYQCCHMVLNCYKVVKQKWYQTGIFKVILMIIAIVLMWFFPPAGVAMIAAVIGTYIVVTAIILKLIAMLIYMLIMMIIANLLMAVATKLFGAQWGALIAVVAMVFVGGAVNSVGNAGAATATAGITAAQVMQITTAVLDGIGQAMNARAADIYKDIGKLQADYEKKFNELEEMTEKMLGTNTDLLDIQGMTDATYQMHFERMDVFLSRTLITGNDVCDITLDQIGGFVDLGLQLPTIG